MEVVEACPENSLADSPSATTSSSSPVPQTWRPPRCSVSTARQGVHSTTGPLSLVASLQSPVSLCATDAPLGRFHVHACTLLLKRLWVLVLLLSACPSDPPLTPPHTCLSQHPPSTKGRKRVEEASTKIGMLHVHPVVGLGGGQVVAVEQGAGVAHYGQKAGMRHVGRPTGPTGVHWTPSIGKARICCGTLLDISPPLRSKICSGVWPNFCNLPAHGAGFSSPAIKTLLPLPL